MSQLDAAINVKINEAAENVLYWVKSGTDTVEDAFQKTFKYTTFGPKSKARVVAIVANALRVS